MNRVDIIEGNKLIGEFMEYNIVSSIGVKGKKRIDFSTVEYSNSPCFHESFDCLMPVCKKIISLNDMTNAAAYLQWCQKIVSVTARYEIEQLYRMVVEFIKWHNENK